jgi:hypothetical protein
MFYLRPFVHVAHAAERFAQADRSATLLRRHIVLAAQWQGKLLITQFVSSHQNASFLHSDASVLQGACHRLRAAGQNQVSIEMIAHIETGVSNRE